MFPVLRTAPLLWARVVYLCEEQRKNPESSYWNSLVKPSAPESIFELNFLKLAIISSFVKALSSAVFVGSWISFPLFLWSSLSLSSLPSSTKCSSNRIIVFLVCLVYVPSSFSSVVNLLLVLILPDAILYTIFQRLTPSFIEQNVFHDFNFVSCTFPWYSRLPSKYFAFLSCLRFSLLVVVWYLLRKEFVLFLNTVISSVHQGEYLSTGFDPLVLLTLLRCRRKQCLLIHPRPLKGLKYHTIPGLFSPTLPCCSHS